MKFALRLLFTLRKLDSSVYFASWVKRTAGAILSLPDMNKLCHAFSAGKKLVVSCLR